ncbi:uncharacterized protein BDR25DRAFT_356649 [Lindgomyces ingoldianus]|uniref:Uncharacterized protein n=1 Tax=Lindgomyces ingoldianus TaxID=673940 RepID=A0ACB6QQZ6_9PLEO|nr:uncharacterized protein BDR25DRAFT_356649 [Lindgomyces ingoldianus]KAF2469419.1 hypothetical protein BDR25DRAFT_356649 [Lindgomyces ingoldianus]
MKKPGGRINTEWYGPCLCKSLKSSLGRSTGRISIAGRMVIFRMNSLKPIGRPTVWSCLVEFCPRLGLHPLLGASSIIVPFGHLRFQGMGLSRTKSLLTSSISLQSSGLFLDATSPNGGTGNLVCEREWWDKAAAKFFIIGNFNCGSGYCDGNWINMQVGLRPMTRDVSDRIFTRLSPLTQVSFLSYDIELNVDQIRLSEGSFLIFEGGYLRDQEDVCLPHMCWALAEIWGFRAKLGLHRPKNLFQKNGFDEDGERLTLVGPASASFYTIETVPYFIEALAELASLIATNTISDSAASYLTSFRLHYFSPIVSASSNTSGLYLRTSAFNQMKYWEQLTPPFSSETIHIMLQMGCYVCSGETSLARIYYDSRREQSAWLLSFACSKTTRTLNDEVERNTPRVTSGKLAESMDLSIDRCSCTSCLANVSTFSARLLSTSTISPFAIFMALWRLAGCTRILRLEPESLISPDPYSAFTIPCPLEHSGQRLERDQGFQRAVLRSVQSEP